MKQQNKIAVIGGTGKSGSYLIRYLLLQKIPVKILLRTSSSFNTESSLVEVVRGDVRDLDAVECLVKGCRAVVSTLGQPKGEPSVFSQASRNVVHAMEQYDIRRYILTTGLNVDAEDDKKSIRTSLATDWMKKHYPETTYDKQLEYEFLLKSDIDWTLVRLPLIELTDEGREMMVSLKDCSGEKISATDLANFLIRQLYDDAYIRKPPFIANV